MPFIKIAIKPYTIKLLNFEFEFELVTGQAATADLSRGTARVNNYKINKN